MYSLKFLIAARSACLHHQAIYSKLLGLIYLGERSICAKYSFSMNGGCYYTDYKIWNAQSSKASPTRISRTHVDKALIEQRLPSSPKFSWQDILNFLSCFLEPFVADLLIIVSI